MNVRLICISGLLAAMLTTGCGSEVSEKDKTHDYPLDGELRYNHIQAKGTHNSYHIEPELSHPEHRYTHKSLDVQLDNGVRQFELDIHYAEGEGILVYHLPGVDDLTTCEYLTDCLAVIKSWSDRHREHQAPLVLLEIADDYNPIKLTDKYPEIEADILSVFPRERIIIPDEVRGDYPTLGEAIRSEGWPVLADTRGKIIFHAHANGAFRDNYLKAYPELAGALMFVDSSPEDSFAAIMPMNDPIGDAERIASAVREGFIVRTRADVCCTYALENDRTRLEAALASGAHFISTDFPDPVEGIEYYVTIPGGAPCRCNPLTAPDYCTSTDIENWE
ncbi:MAG: hypothetical protein JSU92_05265 [Deltaproteobacteria bacterium]|nr:MAG: hypothetical protein JSU92_05265 [Deltaproteobacteria bacterium]